jgi:hypothetical protein
MGKLMIRVNGKSAFEWEGDTDEAAKIEEQVRAMAKFGKVSPDTFAQSAVTAVAERGGFMQPAQEAELVALTYFALNMPTNTDEHPGTIRDYVPLYDFGIDIECDAVAKKFKVDVHAAPNPDVYQS